MSVEGLVRQLQRMLPGAQLSLSYDVIGRLFPPGIEDDESKRALAELVNDCFCDLRNEPKYENVIITKRQ